jgi:hypothetical protein
VYNAYVVETLARQRLEETARRARGAHTWPVVGDRRRWRVPAPRLPRRRWRTTPLPA